MKTRTITRDGFPWPNSTPLYHATIGLLDILLGGFKTRQNLPHKGAMGGRHEWSVSFTLHPGAAEASALGLGILHQGATGDITCAQLYEAASIESDLDGRYSTTYEEMQAYDDGYVNEWDEDNSRWEFIHFENSKKSEGGSWEQYRNDRFREFYSQFLSFGVGAGRAGYSVGSFNPLFFATDMNALAATDLSNIGVLKSYAHIDRICADYRAAVGLGFVDSEKYSYTWRGMESVSWFQCERDIETNIEALKAGDPLSSTSIAPYYGYMGTPKDHDWSFEDTGQRHPQNTAYYNHGERELRVFDTNRIEIDKIWMSYEDIREKAASFRIQEGGDFHPEIGPISYPYFEVPEIKII